MNNRQILEALKMQPLSEEEKQQRHILGRLYGPIATCNSSTRNGRRYNKELWERALGDDLFKEKIANKSLFLELGHPVDREETDMEKICACIPDMPKIVDGDLYAYVDILDTKNGQLLKTLCDYGFVPGISSRGSGDIMDNDEVDPETFFLETWDIVQLPAVKDARLAMCEGLDKKALKLRKALTESYNKASDEDKKVMKEALDNLDIELEQEDIKEDLPLDEIPDAAHEENGMLFESEEEVDDEASEEIEEEPTEETEEESEETESEEDETEEVEAYTVGDLIKELKDFDKKSDIEFKPIVIDDVEYPIEELHFDAESEDGKVIVEIGYNSEMSNNKEVEEEQEIESEEEVAEAEENPEELEAESEEAADDGMDEVVESLKEMIRQKDALENEVKSLKSKKTVGDAEVKKLKEELNKYKDAYARTSEIAATAKEAKVNVQKLTEEISKKDKKIKELESVKANTVALTESANSNELKVKKLTEALNSKQKELEAKDTQLTEQKSSLTKQLNEKIETANRYKARLNEAVNRYIASKAEMLGVRTTEITSRLDNKFSMDDIDKVCDNLLKESVGFNRLPFDTNTRVKFNDAKETKKTRDPEDGYEIDDSLLILAGLKK